MKHSESIAHLSAALAKAQANMPSVPMNSVNPFLKNRFADLGAVITTSRPVLADHGLSVTQFPLSEEGKIGVTTRLMHESGEWLEETIMLPLTEEKGKSAAQVAGSIITYLRRYSWSAVLGLYADEDTDGNGHSEAEKKAERATERAAAERGLPPEQTKAPAAPKNGKPERPIASETLRSFMGAKVQKYAKSGATVTDAQRKVVASVLDTTFNGDSTSRYELCKWLVGEASSKKMTAAQVHALMDWLECRSFEDLPPEYALQEAHSAHGAALKEAGQMSLEGAK